MGIRNIVLIMSEDAQAVEYLREFVRSEFGYEIDCVHSCVEAIFKLQQRSYALLLLDMWMASGDGETVLEWAASNGREEPVVMMCEGGDYDVWLDLLNRGATDLIPKPIVAAELRRVLRSAMTFEKGPVAEEPAPQPAAAAPSRARKMIPADQIAYRIAGVHERLAQLSNAVTQVQQDLAGKRTPLAKTQELRKGIDGLHKELESVMKQMRTIETHRRSAPYTVLAPAYGYRLASGKTSKRRTRKADGSLPALLGATLHPETVQRSTA